MKKRETILLAALGVIVVVAIVIFFMASPKPSPTVSEPSAAAQIAAEAVMGSLVNAKTVLASTKFATLQTYGKIPVVVEPFEMGNRQPLNPSR